MNKPAANAPVTKPRVLTPKETARLSIEIDNHFDPETGKYMGGVNDEMIALKLDLPRASVTAFRDEAFGPLKTNPEVDRAMGILARLECEYSTLRPEVEKLAARLTRVETGIKEATDMLARAGG